MPTPQNICFLIRLKRSLRVFFGTLFETIRGSSVTRIYQGQDQHRIEHLRPSYEMGDVDLYMEAKEVIYETRYRRAWIPNRKRSVYHVKGSVNDKYRDLFDPALFEEVVYPMLCTRWLKGTKYPHHCAIVAFLKRIYPTGLPYR